MPLKIVVTGAAGFIGSHTVDQLLAVGHSVLGVDNFRTGQKSNLQEALQSRRFSLHEMDITEMDYFDAFVFASRPDVIVHLAALVSVPESISNPALNDRLNFDATRLVAEAACKQQVARIVFASSAAVYGDPAMTPTPEDAPLKPLSPYGFAKMASESHLSNQSKKCGFIVRCQRYFNVYGPRQDPHSSYSGVISIFLKHLKHGTSPTIFGDGLQSRDFISVFDVARANMIAATRAGLASGVANICTGRSTSLNKIWEILSHNCPVDSNPNYAPSRHGDIRHSCGSTITAQHTLGFIARISLEEGIAAFVSNHRA